jgi:hypothetical protein
VNRQPVPEGQVDLQHLQVQEHEGVEGLVLRAGSFAER